jgi:DNA-binding response OmpR family regulator
MELGGMRALLAVSDTTLGAALARGLLDAGIDVAVAPTFNGARDRPWDPNVDAVVVDLDPRGKGVGLCRELRRAGVDARIIVLVDADSLAERLRARDARADAFLTKPVDVGELLAFLRASAAPRPRDATSERVTVADLDVDLRTRAVHRAAQPIELTPKEFALLEVLARHHGRPVDRPTIIAHVWNNSTPAGSNMLEVLVRRLRRKIDDGYDRKLIRTRRAGGYQLAD